MRRVAALLLCATAPAFADAPPALRPLHDVDITYKVPVPNGGDQALLQRLRWSAATQRQRVDLPTSGNWMVLDVPNHRLSLVHDDSREIIDLPSPVSAEQLGAGASFTRLGPSTVNGLACTQWRTTDSRGQETQACYTNDGILLRASAGPRILMEAITVKYAPQDAAVFQTPPTYTHQQPNH